MLQICDRNKLTEDGRRVVCGVSTVLHWLVYQIYVADCGG